MNNLKIIIKELLKKDRTYFSLMQIVRATGIDREAVRDVLGKLYGERFLIRVRKNLEPYEQKSGPARVNITYRIIRPKKLAERIAPKYRGENNAMDRIWFIIRKKRHFTRRDLRVLTGVSIETIRWYTKMLSRAGYIGQAAYGEWQLINDAGSRRPYIGEQIKRKGIGQRG